MGVNEVLGVVFLLMMIVWAAFLTVSARRDLKASRIKYENAVEYRRLMREWARKIGLGEGGDAE